MKRFLTSVSLVILTLTPVAAQSLKPGSPAPLQAGINKGTIDNMVGTHYWYLTSLPGQTRVHVQFKSMGLLGNPYTCAVTFTLADAANTWRTPKVLQSDGKVVDYTFTGQIKKPTKLILSVAPPANGLVRTGGEYQIEASGAVAFGKQSGVEQVIGMYKQMCGYTSLLGDCKFNSDGSVATTSGASGKWKLFDKDSGTYVIDMDGQERKSLQLVPGRGLCEGDSIVFQQIR